MGVGDAAGSGNALVCPGTRIACPRPGQAADCHAAGPLIGAARPERAVVEFVCGSTETAGQVQRQLEYVAT